MAMIEDAQQRSDAAVPELIEGMSEPGPRVAIESVVRVAPLRSPLMDHRRVEPLPPALNRQRAPLLPLRPLVRPSRLDLLVGAWLLLVVGWQVAILIGIGVAGYRELERRRGRSGLTLANGFLPYQPETAWPQGVQDDNDVRWNWSAASATAPTPGGQQG